MLKQLPILILLIALMLLSVSCQTMEFGDVVPDAKGSALGDVKLGKPNKDFFVIPGAPITPAQMRGEAPVPPQNIVVFKTRERQPLYKVARAAGAPVRGVCHLYNMVVDAFVSVAFGWLPKKEPKVVQPGAAPVIYPSAFTPTPQSTEPFASARPHSAHVHPNPHPIRNGG